MFLLHARYFASRGRAVEVAFALFAECDDAVFECEEGVVLTNADIGSGKDSRPTLTHDDRACLCHLSRVEFGAEILWIGIS